MNPPLGNPTWDTNGPCHFVSFQGFHHHFLGEYNTILGAQENKHDFASLQAEFSCSLAEGWPAIS